MPPTEEEEAIAALIRAGLWAVFAAASLARAHGGSINAANEADALLQAFNVRFPLAEMLADPVSP